VCPGIEQAESQEGRYAGAECHKEFPMKLDRLVAEMTAVANANPHYADRHPICPMVCGRENVELEGLSYRINIVFSYVPVPVPHYQLSVVHEDNTTRMPDSDVMWLVRSFFKSGEITENPQKFVAGGFIFKLPPMLIPAQQMFAKRK
jgi:hypothetical protein